MPSAPRRPGLSAGSLSVFETWLTVQSLTLNQYVFLCTDHYLMAQDRTMPPKYRCIGSSVQYEQSVALWIETNSILCIYSNSAMWTLKKNLIVICLKQKFWRSENGGVQKHYHELEHINFDRNSFALNSNVLATIWSVLLYTMVWYWICDTPLYKWVDIHMCFIGKKQVELFPFDSHIWNIW